MHEPQDQIGFKDLFNLGSSCGSIGRGVASDTRGPRFKSRHRKNLSANLSTNCIIEKTKIIIKRLGMVNL